MSRTNTITAVLTFLSAAKRKSKHYLSEVLVVCAFSAGDQGRAKLKAPSKFSHILFTVCSVLVWISVCEGAFAQAAEDRDLVALRKELSLGSFLAASRKNVAFPIEEKDGVSILFVDLQTGKKLKLISFQAQLISPYLSVDGTRLLIVRRGLDQKQYELIACETGEFKCRLVLKSSDSIVSPIEISPGRILFAASPFRVGLDGRGRFADYDFHIIEDGTSRRISDFKLYELGTLSLSAGEVYFSAYGPNRNRTSIPQPRPLAEGASQIFKLPFDAGAGSIGLPQEELRPLFLSKGYIASKPAASADGRIIAYLRANVGGSPYRYNLVVDHRELQVSHLIKASELGFSQPIMVDRNVAVRDLMAGRYLVKVFDQSGNSSQSLVDIEQTATTNLESRELKVYE